MRLNSPYTTGHQCSAQFFWGGKTHHWNHGNFPCVKLAFNEHTVPALLREIAELFREDTMKLPAPKLDGNPAGQDPNNAESPFPTRKIYRDWSD